MCLCASHSSCAHYYHQNQHAKTKMYLQYRQNLFHLLPSVKPGNPPLQANLCAYVVPHSSYAHYHQNQHTKD